MSTAAAASPKLKPSSPKPKQQQQSPKPTPQEPKQTQPTQPSSTSPAAPAADAATTSSPNASLSTPSAVSRRGLNTRPIKVSESDAALGLDAATIAAQRARNRAIARGHSADFARARRAAAVDASARAQAWVPWLACVWGLLLTALLGMVVAVTFCWGGELPWLTVDQPPLSPAANGGTSPVMGSHAAHGLFQEVKPRVGGGKVQRNAPPVGGLLPHDFAEEAEAHKNAHNGGGKKSGNVNNNGKKSSAKAHGAAHDEL